MSLKYILLILGQHIKTLGGSTVVKWIKRLRVDRQVRGSNPAAAAKIFRGKSLANSENGWMDACARAAVRARVAEMQDRL